MKYCLICGAVAPCETHIFRIEGGWATEALKMFRAPPSIGAEPKYTGADYEMVQWSDDDGSAANEPESLSAGLLPPPSHLWRRFHHIDVAGRHECWELSDIGCYHWKRPGIEVGLMPEDAALAGCRYLGPAEWGAGNRQEGGASNESDNDPVVSRVAEALKAECLAVFGSCWSNDVAERFAAKAIGTAFDQSGASLQVVTPGMWTDATVREDKARLTAQAEQIGALICRVQQLERDNADLAHKLADAENVRSAAATSSFPLNALKHSR